MAGGVGRRCRATCIWLSVHMCAGHMEALEVVAVQHVFPRHTLGCKQLGES